MTIGGWITMLLSVGTVTVLFGWCIWRVLSGSGKKKESMHGFEFETPDEKTGRDPE